MMDIAALSAEFPREAVHWRVQGKAYERNGKHSAMALAYIDARDVMDRLDEVCGPEGWQSEFTETATGRVLCRLGIKIDGEWVWKTDGAGGTQVEAEKGGISDALKRAAVSWGVGRYLYRLDSPWVTCTVNDKGAWRSWAEDPWSKIKQTAKAADKPKERDPAAIRDGLIKSINLRTDMVKLDAFIASETFTAPYDWLFENDEPKGLEVKNAIAKRKDYIDTLDRSAA